MSNPSKQKIEIMTPTTLCFALSMAFSDDWRDLETVEEYKQLQMAFSAGMSDNVSYFNHIIKQNHIASKNNQRLMDVLVSVVHDMGMDAFCNSPIHEVLFDYTHLAMKQALIVTEPQCDSVAIPLMSHCQKLRVPSSGRRQIEISLLENSPFFMTGRTKRPDSDLIVFGPYPMHPIVRWFFH